MSKEADNAASAVFLANRPRSPFLTALTIVSHFPPLIWVALFGFSEEAAFLNPKIGTTFRSVAVVVVTVAVAGFR